MHQFVDTILHTSPRVFHLQHAIHPYPETHRTPLVCAPQGRISPPSRFCLDISSFSLPTHLPTASASPPHAQEPHRPHEPRPHAGTCVHWLYDARRSVELACPCVGRRRGELTRVLRHWPPQFSSPVQNPAPRARPPPRGDRGRQGRVSPSVVTFTSKVFSCGGAGVVLGRIAPERNPSSDSVCCGSTDELAEQEQGFGDALRADMAARCSCN
ncbi:uncharacterized protein [Triticum aestivum]|uniref:uncharacterized protein n=1 Tax=Triticum aestivum TaxID=4565 RepID=UPI001D030AE3|nr:uncharacterized protein LOC123191730 [Triticum aestivum]